MINTISESFYINELLNISHKQTKENKNGNTKRNHTHNGPSKYPRYKPTERPMVPKNQ